MYPIMIWILLVSSSLLPITQQKQGLDAVDLQQAVGIHPGTPEDAMKVLKEFHQTLVDNDFENAKRLYYEGRIGWSNEAPVHLDYRILTVGPVPLLLLEAEMYPKPSEDDYVAWVEVTMNDVQWNYPHAHYQTILTQRTGKWLVLTTSLIQRYADPMLVYIPGYYPVQQTRGKRILP